MSDAESFREYVRARIAGLSRVAYLLTGDRHLAEDLVQLTLIRVAARWEKIIAGGDPDAYVRRVLYTQHVSWWRRFRRETPMLDLPETAIADPTARIATTLAVRSALSKLAPRQRAVLVLRYFEDMSEADTAAILGISTGTVKSQTRDGLPRLRAIAPELADLPMAEV